MTPTILRIDASARKTGSVTRELSDHLVQRFDGEVITRDLSTPLPQISEDWVAANFTSAEARSETQKAELALSDSLVAEVQRADILVIGLPIYNFGVPASLKAWIDLIARAGVTFRYTDTGPQGLMKGKRAIIAVASGGTEAGSEIDFATGHMLQVLRFIGITDVELVRADRLGKDATGTLKLAHDQINQLAA